MTTLDAQEYVNADGTIDSSPWWTLLTYRDLNAGLPMNSLRVVAVNSADFFEEGQQQANPTLTPVPPTSTPQPTLQPTITPTPPAPAPAQSCADPVSLPQSL